MKLFELYGRQQLREDKTLAACVKLCESVIRALEDFDYEPDPSFAGVKGVSRDTGRGELDAKKAQHKQQNIKLNQTWVGLIKQLRTMDPGQASTLKGNLQKVAKVAKQKGFTLSPSPEAVFA